jgi:hypothetical protein
MWRLLRLAVASAVIWPAVVATDVSPVMALDFVAPWEQLDDVAWSQASQYQSVAVSADGSIFLAGWFRPDNPTTTEYEPFLRKIDVTGSVLWTRPFPLVDLPGPPGPPDLVIDGPGNVYVRLCLPVCRLSVHNPSNGSELGAVTDADLQNPWPPIGVSSGGVLVVSRVDGAPVSLAARRLGPDLGELWSFDLTADLDAAPESGTWLVESPSGSFWAIGSKPGSDVTMVMAQISAAGATLGSVEHDGGVPFDVAWAARPLRRSPIAAGPDDHLWIEVDPPSSGFDRVTTSFSANTGL